jgi:hypothetical protein
MRNSHTPLYYEYKFIICLGPSAWMLRSRREPAPRIDARSSPRFALDRDPDARRLKIVIRDTMLGISPARLPAPAPHFEFDAPAHDEAKSRMTICERRYRVRGAVEFNSVSAHWDHATRGARFSDSYQAVMKTRHCA